MKRVYRRSVGVSEKTLDDVVFLAHPETGGLYQMNATGRALWLLLECGITVEEAARALADAFPDQNRKQILRDVARVMDELEEEGLVAIAG